MVPIDGLDGCLMETHARIDGGLLPKDDERIDEAGWDSFPASDAPPWTCGDGRDRHVVAPAAPATGAGFPDDRCLRNLGR